MLAADPRWSRLRIKGGVTSSSAASHHQGRRHIRSQQRLVGIADEPINVLVERTRDGRSLVIGEQAFAVTGTPDVLRLDGRRVDVDVRSVGPDRVLARLPHHGLDVTDLLLAPPDAGLVGGLGVLVAPMHGAVTAVEVEVGDRVEVGDQVVAIEAMKMEHLLRADIAGTISEVASVGDQVATGAVLARIEPDEADEGA